MLTIEELKKFVKHNLKVFTNDNQIFEGYCTEYLQPEDEDEEHNITLKIKDKGLVELKQSEIVKIELIK